MNKYEEAKDRYQSLLQESKELVEKILELERQLHEAKNRQLELCGGWGSPGKLTIAERQVQLARFPVYADDRWRVCSHVVSLDKKWVGLKNLYDAYTVYYSAKTGVRKGSRNPNDKIDAEKAIRIFKENPPLPE